MKIYTRTGDDGETSLLGGGRVPKDDSRVAAYGEVDELNATLGAAIAAEPGELERALLEAVQRDLFAIGGRLASPRPERAKKALQKATISPNRIEELEAAIDRLEQELPALQHFVVPGGTPKAALLHTARTVCRRAERAVVKLARQDTVPPEILRYLNRLSDLLFVAARVANHRANVAEQRW